MRQRSLVFLTVIGVALGSLSVATPALAAPAAPSDTERAKQYYISGSKHFDLAEYDQALADFKEGYRLKDDPVFLYNIAQCFRLLNKPSDAIQFYKSYLRRQPDAPNADQVEDKIKSLQAIVDAQEKSRQSPPQDTLKPEGTHIPDPANVGDPDDDDDDDGTPPAAAPATDSGGGGKPIYKKWWFWTGVGVVVIGGVALIAVAASGDETSGTTFPMVTF